MDIGSLPQYSRPRTGPAGPFNEGGWIASGDIHYRFHMSHKVRVGEAPYRKLPAKTGVRVQFLEDFPGANSWGLSSLDRSGGTLCSQPDAYKQHEARCSNAPGEAEHQQFVGVRGGEIHDAGKHRRHDVGHAG